MKKIIGFACVAFAFVGCNTLNVETGKVELRVVRHSQQPYGLVVAPYACEIEDGADAKKHMMNVDFLVEISNSSKDTFAFYEEEFEFGYNNFSVEIMNENGEVASLTKHAGRKWTRNLMTYQYVESGEKIVCPISLDPIVWQGIPSWFFTGNVNCSVRVKLLGGYLVKGRKSGRGTAPNASVEGKSCGELVSDWKKIMFR